MDRQKRRIHLNAKACSGRAVTIQNLTPAEKDSCLLGAAKELGVGANQTELGMKASHEAVKMMVIEVTEDCSFKDDHPVTGKWRKVTREELDGSGPFGYDTLFTAKDDGILSMLHHQNTDPTAKEIEAIANNAIPLAD